MPGEVIVAISVCFLVLFLATSLFMNSIARPWLQGYLSGAHVSIVHVILMRLRRSPVEAIMRCQVMAAQAGIDLKTSEIESAALQQIDVETAIRMMIRAKELGVELDWQQAVSKENRMQLANQLEIGA